MRKLIIALVVRALLLCSLTSCTTTTILVDGKPEKAWRLDIPLQAVGLAMGPAATVYGAADMIVKMDRIIKEGKEK